MIHQDKAVLLDCKKKIELFLERELHIRINEKKVYLQSVFMGVKFLGVDIKPGHVNLSRRVMNNFRSAVESINKAAKDHKPSGLELKSVASTVNSYLGICSRYNTHRFKSSMLSLMDERIRRRLQMSKISIERP